MSRTYEDIEREAFSQDKGRQNPRRQTSQRSNLIISGPNLARHDYQKGCFQNG